MEAAEPQLLVALRPSDAIRSSLDRLLPEVPWGYLESTPPEHRGKVEVLLAGSLTREAVNYDPASTPELKFVQRSFTGVDGFPFERFPRSVEVAGNVGAFAPYVAEHAIALALASARDLPHAREMVRAGRLRPAPDQRLLNGATTVILGYGEIGRAIAGRLEGFGTHIVGLNRDGRNAPGAERMFPAERLGDALAEGDLVFEARPLTRLTSGSIGAPELARTRPNAVLVNIGRAATIDEEALFRHLKDHPSFRAAIDVWWDEEFGDGVLRSRFPFADLPNFVGTPHCAGFAPNIEPVIFDRAAENVARYFRDGRPRYVVDRAEYEGA